MLCSTVPASHWLSQLHKITDENGPGVCLIQLKFLCDSCAKQGVKGICSHGQLKIPYHIDAGGDTSHDPVKQLMEYVCQGSYQTEVCGSNFHTTEEDAEVFSNEAIGRMVVDNCIELSGVDQQSAEAVYVSMDPVQAASNGSGIGLTIVVKIEDIFLVSF